MGRYDFDGPVSQPTCERCGAGLTDEHWVRLRAIHQGTSADRYRNSEKKVCPDCLAALGMLEMGATEKGSSRTVRDRLDSIRSLGS